MKSFFSIVALFLFLSATAQPSLGSVAPEIKLMDKSDKPMSLSGLRGKVVLLDFWASWCGPCRRANRHLESLYAKLQARGFEIFSVSIDTEKADWKKAINADKIQWIQVNEGGGWDGAVARTWNIEQIPSTFLIDKQGKIVGIDPEAGNLEKIINELLNLPY